MWCRACVMQKFRAGFKVQSFEDSVSRLQGLTHPELFASPTPRKKASSISGEVGPRDMFARPCAEQSPRAPNEDAGDASAVADVTVTIAYYRVYNIRVYIYIYIYIYIYR